MELAPIVLTVYNRPNHAQKTLSALARNHLAKKSDLYVFADGAKDNEDSYKKVKLVRDVLDSFSGNEYFNSYNLSFSSANQGLSNTIITGVSKVIERYGKVIVLEDDLITSEDFLDYMNGALDYYMNNSKIWSISGYTFPMLSLSDYNSDVYATTRGCSWGWATWEDRWKLVDWEVLDYNSFKWNISKRREFSFSGNDLPCLLDAQMCGEINSWAIRWCYQQFKEKMLTIYPKESRVINMGSDGSGTHARDTNDFDTCFSEYEKKCVFEEVYPNNKIIREFRSKYDRPLLSRMKLFAKHIILNK